MLPLAKSGLAHFYFLAIHPFEDGNGRIARGISEKSISMDLGRPTIYSWMEKGLLKKIPIGGRVLFHPNDINELIDRLREIPS